MNDLAPVFYTFFLWLYRIAAAISSLFNPKAKKWVRGRKNIFSQLENAITRGQQKVWVHCASLGEFEQGRPVIEKIKKEYPGYKILLTFFSPSGYEIQKNYSGADWIFYLPLDGRINAKRFLEIVQPSLVVFVKYEFWYFYLKEIYWRKIPVLLISGIFRENSVFFKWYGSLHRKMLGFFHHLFLQDDHSSQLLRDHDISVPFSVTGDTRFDRVAAIAENPGSIKQVEEFIDSKKAIVAGSTWPGDERILKEAFAALKDPELKLVIAPHQVDEGHLNELKKNFPDSSRFSELTAHHSPLTIPVLIIDNIGLLSRLYQYAYITYVGGGFENGIHNILEAAVYNKVVIFGPQHHKYAEAHGLLAIGGAISINNSNDLKEAILKLQNNTSEYETRSHAAGDFVRSHRGATKKIMDHIQENRLLTN